MRNLYFSKAAVSEDEKEFIKSIVNWDDYHWAAFPDDYDFENYDNTMPDHCYPLSYYVNNPMPLPIALIDGILRVGHKMLISGPSKAGKSFLLMELAISIAEGINWLGFQCIMGKVLYINYEIDEASSNNRFVTIYDALGIKDPHYDNIIVWNMRGRALPLAESVESIVRVAMEYNVKAIIVDPIYKIMAGDENSASEMSAFCNCFDEIATRTHSSVIYCHHHSKGAQGSKKSMDRASGSGVFARDPDAVLDMTPLVLDSVPEGYEDATAFRIESNLREFKNITPINIWYRYQIHLIDVTGILEDKCLEGSTGANLGKSAKRISPERRRQILIDAYNDCCKHMNIVRVKDLAASSGLTERTIREYINESDTFSNDRGVVIFKSKKRR